MKALTNCAAVAAFLAAPAAAEPRYDRKLEQAVLAIVAKKIGDLRGSFSYDAKPQFVIVQDEMPTGSTGIESEHLVTVTTLPDGLERATERKISGLVAF